LTSELWFWMLVIALAWGAFSQFLEHWQKERNNDNEPDWRNEL
jgi:hypothetical protein